MLLCPQSQAEVSGYLKSVWLDSETLVGEPTDYTLGLHRFRLNLQAPIKATRLELSYDQEIRTGDYLDTDQYPLQSAGENKRYWALQKTWHQDEHWEARHGLYRGTLTFPLGAIETRIGRQQINWARGFLWSSLDRFNPYDPLQLEPDERKGVDAAQFRLPIGALQSLDIVAVGGHRANEQAFGLNWKKHWGAMDVDWVAADYGNVEAGGLGAAGQWRSIGFRLEATRNRDDDKAYFNDLILSGDYTFVTQTTLIVEGLYRGSGASDPAQYDWLGLLMNTRNTLARRYVGVMLKQGFEPLANVDMVLIRNLDDHSVAANPTLRFSHPAWENTYFRVGAQRFFGEKNSEYGRLKTLVFAEIQWFY